MAEAKEGKRGTAGRDKAKAEGGKRRASQSQTQTKKVPSKAALKQLAKDWDQVT